jgi:hypothetical protein
MNNHRIDFALQALEVVESDSVQELVSNMRALYERLSINVPTDHESASTGSHAGRPPIEINEDVISSALELQLPLTQIADMLSVSTRCVCRCFSFN